MTDFCARQSRALHGNKERTHTRTRQSSAPLSVSCVCLPTASKLCKWEMSGGVCQHCLGSHHTDNPTRGHYSGWKSWGVSVQHLARSSAAAERGARSCGGFISGSLRQVHSSRQQGELKTSHHSVHSTKKKKTFLLPYSSVFYFLDIFGTMRPSAT